MIDGLSMLDDGWECAFEDSFVARSIDEYKLGSGDLPTSVVSSFSWPAQL